ncbi:MAG TPA: rhomboid family intramembrane serine protease [Cytophaga sp.]|jgi:rhomboid protease GluP|nr:rhomboid family intramembrane serine protease [Cytophaga sp.]
MNFSKRIKLLYLPFLLTAFCIWILYTFLNWLLIIHLELISIKDIIVNFGIPLALPAIPMFFYLRPKFKFLNLITAKGKSWSDFYMFILWLILAAPTMIAQNYIETATGKLTVLQHLNQLDSLPKTKYYSVKDVYIDKNRIGSHTVFEVSGKHNENLDMYIYVVVPMCNNSFDTTNVVSWLGLKYSKTIKTNLEDKEKEDAYQAFADECQKEFDEADLNKFVYLTRVPNSDKKDGLDEALKQSVKRTDANASQLFESVNESFADKNGSKFEWTLISFGIGLFVWLIMIVIPSINTAVLNAHEAGTLNTKEDVKEFVDYFKPKEGFLITPILMYLNIGVFLAMFFTGFGFMSFKSEDLIVWGANYGPLTTNGEWWRLLSNTFLHGGFIHVLANMYGLLFVGIFLEPVLGKMKYIGVYLVTGIIASAASIWWNGTVVSIGASGAIFGLYGAFLALLVTGIFPKEMGKAFMISTLIFVGYNLVIGILGNGTDNAAHIGGLVSGFLIGLVLYPGLKGTIKFDEAFEEENNNDEEVQ